MAGRPKGQFEAQVQRTKDIVRLNGGLTNIQIGEMLGVSSQSAASYVAELKKRNEININVSRYRHLGSFWIVHRKITLNEVSV